MELGASALLGSAAAIGLGTGLITSCWQQAKTFSSKALSLGIVTIHFKDAYTTKVIFLYLKEKAYLLKVTDFSYSSMTALIKEKKEWSGVPIQILSNDTMIFIYKKCPIIFNLSNTGSMSFVRGTIPFEKIIEESFRTYIDKDLFYRKLDSPQSRFFTRRMFGRSSEKRNRDNSIAYTKESDPQVKNFGGNSTSPQASGPINIYSSPEHNFHKKTYMLGSYKLVGFEVEELDDRIGYPEPFLNYYCYPKEVNLVLEDLERWTKSKEWYNKRGIPHRRGLLMTSKPGCGKSTLVKCIGQYLNMPVFVFDISTMSNNEFCDSWNVARADALAIVLIEDIDAIFDKRENILGEKGGGLTFDCLLNTISGVEDSDGILTIITTNCPEKLDSALGVFDKKGSLSSRPGRMDLVLELKDMNEHCRRSFASKMLENDKELVESLVKECEGYTPAQFSEKCKNIALERYWIENSINKK